MSASLHVPELKSINLRIYCSLSDFVHERLRVFKLVEFALAKNPESGDVEAPPQVEVFERLAVNRPQQWRPDVVFNRSRVVKLERLAESTIAKFMHQ